MRDGRSTHSVITSGLILAREYPKSEAVLQNRSSWHLCCCLNCNLLVTPEVSLVGWFWCRWWWGAVLLLAHAVEETDVTRSPGSHSLCSIHLAADSVTRVPRPCGHIRKTPCARPIDPCHRELRFTNNQRQLGLLTTKIKHSPMPQYGSTSTLYTKWRNCG